MGTDVQGYVEINTINISEEDIWFNIIDIEIIAERNYEVFGKIFGIRTSKEGNPLAPSRGIPPNTSNKEKILDKKHNTVVYQSWVNWSELSEFLSNNSFKEELLHGWQFIFSSMAELAKQYGSENIRLVVAFDNYG